MNISEHLWFSAEPYWQAANRQKPWKKPEKVFFFSTLMLKKLEIESFKITLNGFFRKILKIWFFRNLYFLLISCQKTSYWNKKGEKYENTSVNWEKNFTGVIFDVFTVFLREHVKSQRQQCSWLDQKKSVMFRAESFFFRIDAEKISYFQSWFSIVQNSSESIRRSRITSQVFLPNHILGARNYM